MRRIVLATAATLAILAVSFVPNRAEAMTVTTPAGILAAVNGSSVVQEVAYVCRRLWRCGPGGLCGWRRACWWTGGGPYYYGYGTPYPYYYGRPYYRRYW